MAPRTRRDGFTLVELLVVIAIIGILVALLLPAVQAAREAARRTQCKNHLRQLALAALTHEEAMKHFPTGGWGWAWVGDKDRGFGQTQPGGWVFNLLPFIEETSGYNEAGDGDPDNMTEVQLEGARRLIERPITIINCPSRRQSVPYPNVFSGGLKPFNANFPEVSGRLDYAINIGDVLDNQYGGGGPADYAAGDRLSPAETTGIAYVKSEIAIGQIPDGTSKTYLVGEKYLNPNGYETGLDHSDNETWCTGVNNDNYRSSYYPPLADTAGLTYHRIYGSAHPSGFHMSMCDGSVQTIEYGIDPQVHVAGGNRQDGTNAGEGMAFSEVPE